MITMCLLISVFVFDEDMRMCLCVYLHIVGMCLFRNYT